MHISIHAFCAHHVQIIMIPHQIYRDVFSKKNDFYLGEGAIIFLNYITHFKFKR